MRFASFLGWRARFFAVPQDVFDTIEQLENDILAARDLDGAALVQRLRALWSEVISENEILRDEALKANMLNKLMKTEITRLKRQIAKLNKTQFGAKADHNPNKATDDRSQSADDQKTDDAANKSGSENGRGSDGATAGQPEAKETKPRNTSGRGARVWPEHIKKRPIFMGTKDKKCPCGCGGGIMDIEENETLEVIPAQYYVAVRQYPKYRCRLHDKIVGTTFEPRVFPKTTMSNALMANSITMRFGWQLPWNRQENIFLSKGIELSRSTLMRWTNRLANEALLPIYQLMERELKTNSERLFMDETTLPMLQPGEGQTKTSYLYALLRDDRSFAGNKPPVVIYYPRDTRAMHHIHDILSGVSAILQSDSYAGYGRLGRPGTPVEHITPVKCWAHARRNFTDEYEFNKTPDAKTVIQIIAELYEEEAKIRGKPPLIRATHRRQFSVPILDRLKAFLIAHADRHLSKNKMGQAIRYVLRQWGDLTRFVDDGRIDLDTNAVERMFKPTILLRKNVHFLGSDEGAEAWGIHSSIIETCKLNGVNAEPYLKWVFDQIAMKLPRSEYEKLLPWNAPPEFWIKR
ncbi:IS66 family transposase [Celeribacter sp. SCSIO 80788]|uniref:IS66 family transposase n=1 Tax=Celeribacter sp. SCSIO 80788 TaxID=3117013 RepID=UPI003DA29E71